MRRSIILSLALILGAGLSNSRAESGSELAELIVNFKAKTAEAELVARAGKDPKGAPDVIQQLDRSLQSISGWPLRVKQLTSGGGVLAALDTRAVLARVTSDLGAQPGVESVRVEAKQTEKQLYARPAEMVVRFAPGSPESAMFRPRLGSGLPDTPSAWIADRSKALSVPLEGGASGENELRLYVAWESVTRSAMESLEQSPLIDYVEVNRVLIPYDAR